MKERTKVTRKEARERLEQLNLACELARLIRHFFPDLIPLLRGLPDRRHQNYITYPGVVLFMTCILSSIFYISSMRKTSEEFNETVINPPAGYNSHPRQFLSAYKLLRREL